MKKIKRIFIVLALALIGYGSANAQLEVRIRPHRPVIVRTERPSPRHVWVNEDWEWRDGNYVSKGGYWVEPPRTGAVWVNGYWKRGHHGWRWVPGSWR